MDNDTELSLIEDERPEGERAAFGYWDGECQRRQRCVHEKTGVPLRTLYFWQNRWQWKAESDLGLAEVTQLMQDRGKLGFQELLSDAAQRLKKMLADDEVDHREQRENIRLLASIAFASQENVPSTLIDARSITLGQGGPRNPQDALQRATGILEANVASSNNERRRDKRKSF
jgi:hypothetical protein